MASITKHKDGWRAQVYRQGIRRSKVLATRQAAKDWAARQEYEILNRPRVVADMPLADVLRRYMKERSPAKRGHRWEVLQIERLLRDPLASIRMGDLRAHHLVDWRDRRAALVASGTVRREMNLVRAVLTVARREWQVIGHNVMEGVRSPPEPPPRDRLPQPDEIERMAHVAGDDLTTAQARAFHAFRFAMETGMRAGEIVSLTWARVDLARQVATLVNTKNGHAREVPLSSVAVALIEALPKAELVFGLTSAQLDALFRKIKARARVEGLTFHDSRAYACTMLAKKVDVLTLARIIGHRDLRMLQRYYREGAADIAKRLG